MSVLVTGSPGTGKTRLARELAREIRHDHADVVWCEGDGDADSALRAADDACRADRPTLLVLDDLDHAPAPLRKALRAPAGAPLLVLATATAPNGITADETLALGRLAPDAAAALARLHAGARDGELPVDRIVEQTGGVPALVQQAAAE